MGNTVPPALFSSPDFPGELWLDTTGLTPQEAERAALDACTEHGATHVEWRLIPTEDGPAEFWCLHLPEGIERTNG